MKDASGQDWQPWSLLHVASVLRGDRGGIDSLGWLLGLLRLLWSRAVEVERMIDCGVTGHDWDRGMIFAHVSSCIHNHVVFTQTLSSHMSASQRNW